MDVKATSTTSQALLGMSVAGYALGGPAIHWGHRRLDKAGGSFGLRVGLPVAGLLIAYVIGPKCQSGSEGDNGSLGCLPYLAGGAIVGGVAAVTADAMYLARETVANGGATSLSSSLIVAPFFGSNQRGVVLRGTF